MNTRVACRLGLPILALMASFVSPSYCGAAIRVWVANNGVDSPTCASLTNPCRSISQAIDNAQDGDTIFVGPGHYGDVSGNGTFTGPGDEHPQTFPFGEDGCIVCITKSLHIYSVSGAAVTVIAGPSLPANMVAPWPANVAILHDGVDFGSAGHGFTLTGGNGIGVEINLETISQSTDSNLGVVHNMTVAGNVDLGDVTGFAFTGSPITSRGFCPPACLPTARTVFSDNQALNAGTGFKATANTDLGPGPVVFENNLVLGGGGGFIIQPGIQCEGCGSPVSAGIVQLLNNVATRTAGVGFLANLPGQISGNTASYNSLAGFLIVPAGGAVFQRNSAIGNGGPGVLVEWSPDTLTPVAGSFKNFTLNNLFGNDRNRPAFSLFTGAQVISNGYSPGPSAHCGILNVGALAAVLFPNGPPPATPLSAAYDYWGAPTGPKASGGGDAIGGACDQNGAVTTAKFPAATAYTVSTSP